MSFDSRYSNLNSAQATAVDQIDGPVMVVAGPGTGKTELLSMRSANILRQTDTLPENILCLTFTESGAAAMRQRMVEIIGPDAYKIAIHTFHSFGTEIINQNAEFFYQGADFTAADELSTYEVLRNIFAGLDHKNPLAGQVNEQYLYLPITTKVISELKKSGLNKAELLAVLDANQTVIDTIEPKLAATFADRLTKSTVERLRPLVDTTRSSGGDIDIPGIVALSQLLADSLQTALDEADQTNSTKPVTAWRNAWMKKNPTGDYILKSNDSQAKLRVASEIYQQYIQDMQKAELYDFDDMILQVVHAMEKQPELLFNLQEKYQYIMVDEFQDTNLAQMRILHNLTSNPANNGRPDIMIVGDDDQAIFSFQGADISNILDFRSSYHQPAVVALTDNYRSAQPILATSRQVITQAVERLENTLEDVDKSLSAHNNPADSEVNLLEFENPYDETEHLVQSIAQQIDGGQPASSIAVLARNHKELIGALPHFSRAGIAVNYERRDNILEIEPIVALQLVSRLLVALYDGRHDAVNAYLPELLAHPAWDMEASQVWQLSLQAHTQNKSWMEVMAETPRFQGLHSWLITAAQQVPHMPLDYILDIIIGRSRLDKLDFQSPLFDYFFPDDKLSDQPDEYLIYLEALRTLRSKLRDYQPSQTPTLRTILKFIDLHKQLGSTITSIRPRLAEQDQAVNLMTAHKSKGLEFDSVYIIGAVDNVWGARVSSRGRLIGYPENLPLAPSGGSLDERMRLFFVAMTRARQKLTISYATSNHNGKSLLPASFLLGTELEPEAITINRDNQQQIEAAQQRWYEPLLSLSSGTMKQLLAPTLENYKLSATHLNNFLDISRGGPQNFLMNNLLRFPQAMSPSAAYGSAVHSVLQRAHSHLTATGQPLAVQDVLADFADKLGKQHLLPEDLQNYLQKGQDSLTSFLTEKYHTFQPSQKVELNFASQQVVVDQAHLTGSLDLVDIDRQDKTITVTDYKTGQASRDWKGQTDYQKIKLHKYKQQLMFYKLLVEQSRDYHNYRVTQGRLQFIEPTASGEILSLEDSISDEELADFRRLIEAIWQRIISLDLPDAADYSPDYKGMLELERSLIDNFDKISQNVN